jgi:sugar lactone lactonase YvrE
VIESSEESEESAVRMIDDYEILYHWSRLEWLFPDEAAERDFNEKQLWKGAMAAGFKIDRDGNHYLSVPRWAPGIPATVNRVVQRDGRTLLDPYPSWEMNEIGDVVALQSVLGWEIDERNRAWFLDQGHIEGQPCLDGAQKIVCWDIDSNSLVKSVPIPSDIADYGASFLNDLMVDNVNGFVYIADSGIFSDPLQGQLIVYDMNTDRLRRVLHQHESTQDVPGYWFEIDGEKIWLDEPMRTGADGIALSADRERLYWCALTARHFYSIDTALLRDFTTDDATIEAAVVDHGDKGTNTDGMSADNNGLIYYTMLEGKGIGVFDPVTGEHGPLITDDRMVWVDGMTFDNHGHLVFNNNRLHQLFGDRLDWDDPYNMIVWKARLGRDVKSYLHADVA